MILMVGASGHLGRRVIPLLLERGAVRAMTRDPLKGAYLEHQGAEVVIGDLRDPALLAEACKGVDCVVAAGHALADKGSNNPHSVDDLGNRHLIDAAKAAGVKHLVFVSIQDPGPNHPVPFFRIKYHIEEYLRASGLGFTILRPTAYMDLWAEIIGQPVINQGQVMIFGKGDNPINFVAAEDVAHYVCLAVEEPRASGRIIPVGGPENLTMNQVVGIYERLSERPAKKRHIPLAAMRAMFPLMRLANPSMGRLVQLSIFMDTGDLRGDITETPLEFRHPMIRFEDWAQRNFKPAQR